ncbi:hypothetical protein BJY00DRAFT_288759, partial [Aspergillus carlsbadensis]
ILRWRPCRVLRWRSPNSSVARAGCPLVICTSRSSHCRNPSTRCRYCATGPSRQSTSSACPIWRTSRNSSRSQSTPSTRSSSQRSPWVGRAFRVRGSRRKFHPRVLLVGSSCSSCRARRGTTSSRASSLCRRKRLASLAWARETWPTTNSRSPRMLRRRSL